MQSKQMVESPRIALLRQALLSGNTSALEIFWQEIIGQDVPLIEAIEGEPKHYFVTFLWHDKGNTDNVVIWGGPAGLDHPEEHQMTRLLASNLWYKTYRLQSDLRGVYTFSVNDSLTEQVSSGFGTRFIPDPLNSKQYVVHKDEGEPNSQEVVYSIVELPDAPQQSWIIPQSHVAKGQIEVHRLRSEILNNERRVWVYIPAGYTESIDHYPLLLLFDGWTYLDQIPTPIILDNLVHAGKIPPFVAVLLDSLDSRTRSRELACHKPFVDFLKLELIPWLHNHYRVTNDSSQTIVGGCSYGGLAAAFVGLHASEIFGNVLSQSGSFWWDKDPDDGIQQEWIIQEFIKHPCLPLRFYLEVGLKEDWEWIYMVGCNRHLRDVLTLKGYEVHYSEFNGYHHNVSHRGSFADGLIALVEC